MPRGDGTGPLGQGPATGGGRGGCTPAKSSIANRPIGRGMGRGMARGMMGMVRGMGLGRGMGPCGGGMGWGRRSI